MRERQLEVSFVDGKVFAAYLYLPHPRGWRRVAKSRPLHGVLVIDIASDGNPVGIEIISPSVITIEQMNKALESVGQSRLTTAEFEPLRKGRRSKRRAA